MLMPSTLSPYDAGASIEGTRDRYQRMVSVATSQPLASAVRRQRRGINAHQLCREEEQLRAASKSAKCL
jgi:hypothetical protein